MQTAQKIGTTLTIPREKLVGFVRGMVGGVSGYEDPDNPLPPGPWDPYIRKAMRELLAGPVPDPWRSVLGPSPQPWREVMLNPQPLPPRAMLAVAVAREVIERAELTQEIANALQSEGQQHGIIIVGGLISRFIDDCGNDRLWPKHPIPPPHGTEPDNKLTSFELIAMGAQFEHESRGLADARLREELRGAGARLIEMGVTRM
jgi:hypothetical protein